MSREYRRPTAGYAPRKDPDLFLNFIPLVVQESEFEGTRIRYESSEQLQSLRDEHFATYVLRRQGNEIACIPLVPDAPPLGELETFRVPQSVGLVCRLIQEAFIRLLVSWDYRLLGYNPPSFVARQSGRDILTQVAGDEASIVSWLHVYPRYTLDARAIHRRDGPHFGVTLGLSTRREIDCSAADLLVRGMDLRGRYVLAESSEPLRDHRRDASARRHVEGRVEEVVGTRLILGDAPRLTELLAVEAWLEARRENFAAAIRQSGLPDPDDLLRRLDLAIFDFAGAKGRHRRVIEVADSLRRNGTILLANGLSCTVEIPRALTRGMHGGTLRRISSPTFIFDQSGMKTARSQDRGMEEFGPFDAEVFTPKRPHIAIVAPKAFQGDVEVFFRKFKNGVPNAKTFAQGFVRKYRLSDCTFQMEAFEPGTREAAAYREACLRAINASPKPDLAFVIVKEEHKNLPENDDPYLVAKSTFMALGVPVQEVTIETVRVPPRLESGVPYTLSGIGLACYAKLGGTPFVVNASQSLAEELVIGIGSASIRGGRLTEAERVVGITTVFTADGTYLLHNTSREVPYDKYPDELLATLRKTVEWVRDRNAWQTGDALRLVFHVFKPLKDVEAQAVKRLVEGLIDDYRVEFAFLHVSEDHEWMMIDRNSDGVKDWQAAEPHLRGRVKGEYVPERGQAVLLSRSEILLTTIGPKGLMSPLQGAPRPLLLKLHRESTFKDLDYLAGQLYRFTSLSWRSLFPISKPVTIVYSDLIASLLGRLRRVRNWNADVLDTMLRSSRWFL